MTARLTDGVHPRIGLGLGVVVGLIVAVSCTDAASPAPEVLPPRTGVTGITVSPASATLSVGDSIRFRATPTLGNPLLYRDTSVSWANSRPDVAQIDSLTGWTRAMAPGMATLTATLRADVNFKASVQLSVIR